MITSTNKITWNDRLKTADNVYLNEILHNFGLSGGPSFKDLPYVGLTGLAGLAISPKIRALRARNKERRQEKGVDDSRNVNSFSDDMSKMRNVVNQRKPVRNHPSMPGFNPDVKSPYGIFDYESDGYIGGPPPGDESAGADIVDIREHPRFNSADQGRTQKGRPFDRDEE